MTGPIGEPAWKQRAVERSTKATKLRAEQRVQRFLDAAKATMNKKGSTDFTVQEVVDRSRQSLRSFYLHFDGKQELLLALFEDALAQATEQIRTAAYEQADPLERLKAAVQFLFELSRPDPSTLQPLFTDFAPRLLVSGSTEMRVAHAPLLVLFAELIADAKAAGQLPAQVKPHRMAALTMQTIMFVAQYNGGSDEVTSHPITSAEAWDFCLNGFARHDQAS